MIKLSKETHLEMFTKMERIREFDSRINKLVRRGFVQGMTHFSVGEEAANVGAVQHLSYDDIFFSNHRGHGQSIAQDMDLNKMMAELAGKATGVSKGRGGSMHLADFEKGNYGTNGIVGGGYALAVGAALTQQYKETGNIVVAFSGDGATNEGSFHESVNMASAWKLPVIFFIINNRYVSQWIFIELPTLLICIHVRKPMVFQVSTVRMVMMSWQSTKQWARLWNMFVVEMVLLSLR